MDGHPRQNPAYRPATAKPPQGGFATSGPEDDLERGAAPGRRAQREPAFDRLGAGADVLQALSGRSLFAVEAPAVVGDVHEPLAEGTLADRHLGAGRVRMLANVCQSFLHDAEDLDLLVRCEPGCAVDFELDLEPAAGAQDVDVASQCGIERRCPAC